MSRIHRSPLSIVALTALLSLALVAPAAAQVEDDPINAAPAGPTWDETSGYGAVEENRAASMSIAASAAITSQTPSDVRWAPARAIAPEPSIEASRAIAAERALASGDLGSMQEEALFAVTAAAASWDETSGYGSVEANRAVASQVSLAIDPASGEDLAPSPAIGASWDESSGYGSVESSRAASAPAIADLASASRVSRATDLGSLQEEHLVGAP